MGIARWVVEMFNKKTIVCTVEEILRDQKDQKEKLKKKLSHKMTFPQRNLYQDFILSHNPN